MKTEYVIVRETIKQSIIIDTCTFSLILLSCFLNHKYCGGSVLIDLFAILGVISAGANYYNGRKMTVKKFKQILESEDRENPLKEVNLNSSLEQIKNCSSLEQIKYCKLDKGTCSLQSDSGYKIKCNSVYECV